MAQAVAVSAGAPVLQPKVAGEANVAVMVEAAPDAPRIAEQLALIANRLETLAGEQVTAKLNTEQDWLQAVRAFHGYYDIVMEKLLLDAKQSRAFVKLTRSKTVTLEARLFDLIFPTDDRNWGIEATPVPKLSKEGQEASRLAKEAADRANDAEAQGDQQGAQQAIAQGQDQADRHQTANAVIEASRLAADKMQDEIDDQLTESKYPAESRKMIHDACLLGTGILKGPMVNEKRRGKWIGTPDPDGGATVYNLEQADDPRPMVRRVDPWSFFPDMSASSIDEAEFTFERYLWTKKDLRDAVKKMGFYPDAVREILRDDRGRRPTASNGLNYLTQLRSITGNTQASIKGRYIGWEYHGPLDCEEVVTILAAMGQHELAREYELRDDPLEEFRVVLYFCEGTILKLSPEYPLDSGETLYSLFNVEEAEGTMFGYGIPHIMADSQIALNSAWRMGLDNAGLSVGPQTVIDKDAIVPADGSWSLVPKKIWHRIKAQVANTAPPVEFFNVPNNMEQIERIIQIALQFIDLETGLPMPQQGDQTNDQTKTVGGMTILQNNANIIFRRMVKNYDDGIISPTMRRLYDWNMQFNPRDDIKGDMQIDARGTAVLLLKEIQAQNLMFIVTQLLQHPVVQPMLKPYQNVMKLFQSMMISPADVMVTEDEYKEALKKLAQQPPPPDPAEIQAKSRVDAAKIQAAASGERNNTTLEIETMKRDTAMLQLANSQGVSLESLRTDLAKLDKTLASQERIKAVEIAVEDKRAREAAAEGRPEDKATGQGIG